MNLTLVLTGLATCGSLTMVGLDWSCGQEQTEECPANEDCGDQGTLLGVRVGVNERPRPEPDSPEATDDDRGLVPLEVV